VTAMLIEGRHEDRPEAWRSIPGTNGLYAASDLGRVKSSARTVKLYNGGSFRKPGRVLKQQTDRNGYKLATLYVSGSRKTHLVHRLVFWAFKGEMVKGLDVAHLDGDPSNNAPENLVQCTRIENLAHQIEHGTRVRGEDKKAAKLRPAQVREIRRRQAEGESYRQLAATFSVSDHTIGVICRREGWTHVD